MDSVSHRLQEVMKNYGDTREILTVAFIFGEWEINRLVLNSRTDNKLSRKKLWKITGSNKSYSAINTGCICMYIVF